MKRWLLALVFAITTLTAGNVSDALSKAGITQSGGGVSKSQIVSMLTDRLEVSPRQAAGGTAALLKEAAAKMPKSNYAALLKDIPGLSQLADGKSLGNLMNLASQSGFTVDQAFKSLGMNSDMVKQFTPVILDYAKKFTSAENVALLQKAWSAL